MITKLSKTNYLNNIKKRNELLGRFKSEKTSLRFSKSKIKEITKNQKFMGC